MTGENRRTRRKTCPSATLSTTNPIWVEPGANPGLRGERPASNDLSHGTAQIGLYLDKYKDKRKRLVTKYEDETEQKIAVKKRRGRLDIVSKQQQITK
jgi:hypothetical protein